jgi:hypothetical protein
MGFQDLSLVALLPAWLQRAKSASSEGFRPDLLHRLQGVQFSGSATGSVQKNQASLQAVRVSGLISCIGFKE